MSLEAVTCASCGAKVREDRVRCLRCGRLLVVAPSPRLDAVTGGGAPLLGLAVVAVLAAGIWLAGTHSRPVAVATPPAPAMAPVAASTPPATAPGTPPPIVGRFVDPARAARAAYQQDDLVSALEGFEAAVRRHPGDAEAHNSFGQVLVRTGRAAEALPEFDRAIALNGSKWSYRFNRARAYAQLDEWPRAVDDYTAALALFPGDHVTEHNLGLALDKAGRTADALQHLGAAADAEPSDPALRLAVAVVADRAGRDAAAVAAYEAYLALAPPEADAARARARIAALKTPARAPAPVPRDGALDPLRPVS